MRKLVPLYSPTLPYLLFSPILVREPSPPVAKSSQLQNKSFLTPNSASRKRKKRHARLKKTYPAPTNGTMTSPPCSRNSTRISRLPLRPNERSKPEK
jgi:hypothetical protein